MWQWLRPVVQSAVSAFWEDVEAEIQINVEGAVRDLGEPMDLGTLARAARGPSGAPSCFLWLRARILYHYLPFDKTIFGKLIDPVYLTMIGITMLPLFGVRFLFFGAILLLLLFPGPPDEYQLVSFILHFKGTQFFTSGVLMTFIGAMQQYSCYVFHEDDLRRCVNSRGPGATQCLWSIVFDYFGSVALVWVAFLVLPRSNKHPKRATLRHATTMERRGTYCCCLQGVVTRGGRLRRLLRYDVTCFGLSLAVFVSTCVMRPASQGFEDSTHVLLVHVKSAIYWGNCLYALLSLPFIFFVIPVFSWLLTHSVVTGYNTHGALVEFTFPPRACSKV
mmetsp:Transcript_115850/g.362420  ORF Transcript_115850/g.362420 Transcript_115850/m.362420 type:complete len:334 (+) Transcript_115850:1-1002(+)